MVQKHREQCRPLLDRIEELRAHPEINYLSHSLRYQLYDLTFLPYSLPQLNEWRCKAEEAIVEVEDELDLLSESETDDEEPDMETALQQLQDKFRKH